jgi:hypothetical protein
MIRRAQHRIFLSSLYIGSSEIELVCNNSINPVIFLFVTNSIYSYLRWKPRCGRIQPSSYFYSSILIGQRALGLHRRRKFYYLYCVNFPPAFMFSCFAALLYVVWPQRRYRRDLTKAGVLGTPKFTVRTMK